MSGGHVPQGRPICYTEHLRVPGYQSYPGLSKTHGLGGGLDCRIAHGSDPSWEGAVFMPAGRIYSCARCSITLVTFGDDVAYEWVSREVHDCSQSALFWVDALAEDALSGDVEAAHMLPLAIDAWLAL